jgi:hypothetical protein
MCFGNLNAMEIRLKMKEQGWDSKDQISESGWKYGYGYSIWFERWDWHGRNTLMLTGHQVCFHRHTNDLNRIDETARLSAEQALSAYNEFTKSVPHLNANGEISEDLIFNDWDDPKVIINS